MLLESLPQVRRITNVKPIITGGSQHVNVVHGEKKRRISSTSAQPLRASRRTPLLSGPNNDLPAAHHGRDRAISAVVVTGREIAFLQLEKHLFWLNERPKNADSSSAFAADIRGNRQK
jgi:hypothetical protein